MFWSYKSYFYEKERGRSWRFKIIDLVQLGILNIWGEGRYIVIIVLYDVLYNIKLQDIMIDYFSFFFFSFMSV